MLWRNCLQTHPHRGRGRYRPPRRHGETAIRRPAGPYFLTPCRSRARSWTTGTLGRTPRHRTDCRAFFAPLEDGGEYALRTWWLPRADRSSHCWESMRLTAARYLRDRDQPLPDALAQWLVAVLDGTCPPPPRRSGPKGFHLRNIWIMGAVNTLMALGPAPDTEHHARTQAVRRRGVRLRCRAGRARGAASRHDLQGGRTNRTDPSEKFAAQ